MTSQLGKVEWVPIMDIPLPRRKQTLAVLFYVFCVAFSFILFPIIYLYLLISTRLWWAMVLYGLWMVYDQESPNKGSYLCNWMRNWHVWNHFRNYFPISLEKSADLDSTKKYIFGYHPHGIASLGAFATFCTNATGFQTLFPGITPRLCTLHSNFWIPFRREFLMLLGFINVSKESIQYVLNKPSKGDAVVIVIGGAEEALNAHSGEYNVTLANRFGFIKMALKYGASLVPVYSFGENDLYIQASNPQGSDLRRRQTQFKKLVGFSPPIFHGRGIFNYTFGFMPYRKPMHVIAGKPISVPQNSTPTREDVQQLHEKYCDALQDLFDSNKQRFGIDKDAKLNFV